MLRTKTAHTFPVKGGNSFGKIELISNPDHINKEAAKTVLVESFISEYEKYLSPNDISDELTSWRDGDKSVKKYYEAYFETELEEFKHGKVHFWVQASINGEIVGWATFQREKLKTSVYMNLLVVHPKYQQKGIGGQLVQALINLNEIPDLIAINLLLRKKNKGGRIFYSKLGFVSDPEYSRDDNFVDTQLLEGWAWRRLSLQNETKHEPNNSISFSFFRDAEAIKDTSLIVSPEGSQITSAGKPKPVNKSKYMTLGLFAVAIAIVATKIAARPSTTPKL